MTKFERYARVRLLPVEVCSVGAQEGESWPAEQEVQLLPLGHVKTLDGREFIVDARTVAEVTRLWDERANDLVVDYHHSTVNPFAIEAPAAGWITTLEWRLPEGLDAYDVAALSGLDRGKFGLFGTVEWTGPARDRLAAREYRYLSPVVTTDAGEPVESAAGGLAVARVPVVVELQHAALVNDPAIDGMLAVAAGRDRATAELTLSSEDGAEGAREGSMSEVLKVLGYASIEEATAGLSELRAKAEQHEALSTQLGEAQAELVKAREQLAEQETRAQVAEVDAAIAEGVSLGRVRKGEGGNEAFARKLAGESLELYREWLAEEKPAGGAEPPKGRLALGRRGAGEVTMPAAEDVEELELVNRAAALARTEKIPLDRAIERLERERGEVA